MKVFDSISCSAEFMDTPQWVAAQLNDTDTARIAEAQQLLIDRPHIRLIEMNFEGNWDMAEIEGKWKWPELRVSQYTTDFRVTEDWSGQWIEVNLNDQPSSDWVWNDEQNTALEVEHES